MEELKKMKQLGEINYDIGESEDERPHRG